MESAIGSEPTVGHPKAEPQETKTGSLFEIGTARAPQLSSALSQSDRVAGDAEWMARNVAGAMGRGQGMVRNFL